MSRVYEGKGAQAKRIRERNYFIDQGLGKYAVQFSKLCGLLECVIKFDKDIEAKLNELLAAHPAELRERASAIRAHVLDMAGECRELLYETHAMSNVFTYSGKLGDAFIQIATYSKHPNLGFNCGTELDDPQGLLQGNGKSIRHIRDDSLAELLDEGVNALIQQAFETGRLGE